MKKHFKKISITLLGFVLLFGFGVINNVRAIDNTVDDVPYIVSDGITYYYVGNNQWTDNQASNKNIYGLSDMANKLHISNSWLSENELGVSIPSVNQRIIDGVSYTYGAKGWTDTEGNVYNDQTLVNMGVPSTDIADIKATYQYYIVDMPNLQNQGPTAGENSVGGARTSAQTAGQDSVGGARTSSQTAGQDSVGGAKTPAQTAGQDAAMGTFGQPSANTPSYSSGDGVINNPLKAGSDIPTIIASVLGLIVKIGAVVATFAFIYSGFLFVKAQGNEKELETAKTVFTNTCIGVAVLLGAQLIASIIIGTINTIK